MRLRMSAALALALGIASAPRNLQAQRDSILAAAAGIWDVTAMIGTTDSVVARYQMQATATREGWTVMLPGRPTLPLRVAAADGDSVVTLLGPFASILRRGQLVTTRTVWHYRGDSLTGRIDAIFSAGDTLKEKVRAIRR